MSDGTAWWGSDHVTLLPKQVLYKLPVCLCSAATAVIDGWPRAAKVIASLWIGFCSSECTTMPSNLRALRHAASTCQQGSKDLHWPEQTQASPLLASRGHGVIMRTEHLSSLTGALYAGQLPYPENVPSWMYPQDHLQPDHQQQGGSRPTSRPASRGGSVGGEPGDFWLSPERSQGSQRGRDHHHADEDHMHGSRSPSPEGRHERKKQ